MTNTKFFIKDFLNLSILKTINFKLGDSRIHWIIAKRSFANIIELVHEIISIAPGAFFSRLLKFGVIAEDKGAYSRIAERHTGIRHVPIFVNPFLAWKVEGVALIGWGGFALANIV